MLYRVAKLGNRQSGIQPKKIALTSSPKFCIFQTSLKKGLGPHFLFPFLVPSASPKELSLFSFYPQIFFGLYSKLRFCGAQLLKVALRCFIALLDEIRDSASMGLNLGIPSAQSGAQNYVRSVVFSLQRSQSQWLVLQRSLLQLALYEVVHCIVPHL